MLDKRREAGSVVLERIHIPLTRTQRQRSSAQIASVFRRLCLEGFPIPLYKTGGVRMGCEGSAEDVRGPYGM